VNVLARGLRRDSPRADPHQEAIRRVAILTNVTHSDRLLGFDVFLKQRPERAPPLKQLVKASAEGRAENHHAHRQEGL